EILRSIEFRFSNITRPRSGGSAKMRGAGRMLRNRHAARYRWQPCHRRAGNRHGASRAGAADLPVPIESDLCQTTFRKTASDKTASWRTAHGHRPPADRRRALARGPRDLRRHPRDEPDGLRERLLARARARPRNDAADLARAEGSDGSRRAGAEGEGDA